MDINSDKDEGAFIAPIHNLNNQNHSNNTIKKVDTLLDHAISLKASDIHLQPTQTNMRIRFRIDGVLHDQEPVETNNQQLIISRLKVLSSLDISKKRVPQDGKLRIKFNSKNIDLRISTFPSIYGEKMVIRILDRSQREINLNSLGIDEVTLSKIKTILDKKEGFFLVCGPTGSGKTTTLYSMLSTVNDPGCNIVTMEDPVEYNLDGIMQSQVNSKVGLTFDNGLRSLLRQDPDIIMIGEIRDFQTSKIAIEAALTGHLVLSTLHTNDAPGAITRLIDMGIEPFLINATLSGILAQRLVRKLCSNCKSDDFKSVGCYECSYSGYQGRTLVCEFLELDDHIRGLISNHAPSSKIKEHAIEHGMQTIKQHAEDKFLNGVISQEEFLKTY